MSHEIILLARTPGQRAAVAVRRQTGLYLQELDMGNQSA
jgi:hypothetical protein